MFTIFFKVIRLQLYIFISKWATFYLINVLQNDNDSDRPTWFMVLRLQMNFIKGRAAKNGSFDSKGC